MATKKTEKPVEILEDFQCCGKDECEVCPYDEIEVEVIPEPVKKVEQPKTYVAKDGDTYVSIAEKFKPKDLSRNEYAKHLYKLNNWKSLRPGTEVKL